MKPLDARWPFRPCLGNLLPDAAIVLRAWVPIRLVSALTFLTSVVSADSFGPAFTGYAITPIFRYSAQANVSPNVPVSYGAVAFDPSNSNKLLLGGVVGGAGASFYSVTLLRDAAQHITGSSGVAARFASAPQLGGGADYYPQNSPSGVLFYSLYSGSGGADIGQIKPGSTVSDKTTDVIPETPGAVAFVPLGFGGAGQLKIVSYSGKVYSVAYTPDGTGTYNFAGPALVATLPSTNVEAMAYVKSGAAGFTSDSLLVTEGRSGVIAAYQVDASGNPQPATRRVFFSGPPFALPSGLCFDPLSGDLLVSTAANSSSTVYRISGFPPPSGGGTVFRALPDASPRSGIVPLTVTFRTKGEYSAGQILRYRWDFEGDGVFDTSEVGARDFTRTFTTPGVRNARLEIQNDKLETTSDTVQIVVGASPPTATASVSPSNGAIPLAVTFAGTGTAGGSPITKYEWDFQGDGTFDFTSTTTGNAAYSYTSPGTFNAVFRVTDAAGLTATAAATATAVRPGPAGSPTATITTPPAPQARTAPAAIAFNGTGTDPDGSVAKYEWDFNGDGVYDYSSTTTAGTSYTYNSPGTFTVAFRVTDNDGKTGVDTVDISISIAASLSVSTDTLRPPATVNINTTLGGSAPVTIFLRNRAGQKVRTLVDNVARNAGSYTDSWDGKDDAGTPLPQGVYYAILQYLANGVPRFVDLTNSTGNVFFNPSWSLSTTAGGDCFSCFFAPFEDNFLRATVTLNQAAEITVSIRGFNTVKEYAGVLNREPFGRGTFELFWDGADALGQLVHPEPPDSQFIWGMTGFTLPINGIFLESAPQITNLTVTPNYYDPATGNFLTPEKPKAKAQFTLSETASIRVDVYRVGSSSPIRTILTPNVPAGAAGVEWDGKADNGIFVAKGDYRLGLRAIDAGGSQSVVRYLLMRVFY